jgi:hypothetical protein
VGPIVNGTQVTNDGLGIELRVHGAHGTRGTSIFNRKSGGRPPHSKLQQFRVSLASAAFALTGSLRGFFQANTLVAVIGHAQIGALVI